LSRDGPKWGYFPEPTKSILIIKPGLEIEAARVFQDLNVQIEYRFLGNIIGPKQARKKYIQDKVKDWVNFTTKLANAAIKSPQAAYTAFTKSLQHEWDFCQHVVKGCEEDYVPLNIVIHEKLTPAILGREINETEHHLFELPVRYGGLALTNPVSTVESAFSDAVKKSEILVQSIVSGTPLNSDIHENNIMSVSKEIKKQKEDIQLTYSAESQPN